MKQLAIITLLALTLPGSSRGAESAKAQEQQLLATIKQIQEQQTLIAENQAKIEAKLATVAEAVRVARIYSSRSGN